MKRRPNKNTSKNSADGKVCQQDTEEQDKPSTHNVCGKCGKQFSKETHLKDHIKNIHNKYDGKVHKQWLAETGGICAECGKIFKSKRALTAHKRQVHNERKFECSFCGNLFPNPTNLRKHIRTVHEEKVHRCSKCDKVYGDKCNLREGMGIE